MAATVRVSRLGARPAKPEEGSAAPDGYAPVPAWPGQTRAPKPARTTAFDVQTVAEGLTGAMSFAFLPDGRILVGERPGRIRIVEKGGAVSEPLAGMPPNLWAQGQGLFDVRPDCAFAANRTLYLTYTVLPDGADPAALPRSPGVLLVARATLSADGKRLDALKVLLDAEGTGGRVIQAPDGTLFVTSTIPAGLGVNSVDWPQPQQLDSNMGKVMRINADGSIPRDNPFAGRAGAHPEIYALGFRDVQGVAIHPRTGALWTSEHGPRGGDEINAVAKGRNYGFPGDRLRPRVHRDADQRRQDDAAGDGATGVLLDPRHRAGRHRVLYREALSGVAGRSLRLGACGEVAHSPRPQRPARRRRGTAADRSRQPDPRRR
jgi:glucose/arabinose dehydrogenase